jgi:hypothetical protein
MCIKAVSMLLVLACARGSREPQCDDKTSFMQTGSFLQVRKKSQALPGFGPCDPGYQAPAEGGEFSNFFNARTSGRGIHKWLQYFPAYNRHFGQFIGKEVHIMEIGIQSGGSLDMWKSAFGPNAHVYGADINAPCKLYEDNRTKVFIGDQADPKFWDNVKKQVPRIDILIDDGGHTQDQMTATLGLMLEHLSPNGIYVTEDIHGQENPFWHALQLNQLDSSLFHFKDLGKHISSVHVYPYLLVIEKAGNKGENAMHRQLGIKNAADMPATVKHIFPSMDPKASDKVQNDDLSPVLMQLPPKAWLVVHDRHAVGLATKDMSCDGNWDDKSDMRLHQAIEDFKMLHEGTCCNPDANLLQQSLDSLHFYPQLLIAQRTGEKENRLVKAPQHGSSWIPYGSGETSTVEYVKEQEQAR